AELSRIEELQSWPRFWCEEILHAFSAIRDLGLVGETALGPTSGQAFADMSNHDMKRFLARLVGADATTWRLPRVSDAEWIDALLQVAQPRGFRGLVFAELLAAVSGGVLPTLAETGTESESPSQFVEWALRLSQRPVPRDVLVAIGDSQEVPA